MALDLDLLVAIASGLAALVALVFAGIVWLADRTARRNRHLAFLLVCEAALHATLSATSFAELGLGDFLIPWTGLTLASAAYLIFSTTLEGRLARRLSGWVPRTVLLALCAMVLAGSIAGAVNIVERGGTPEDIDDAFGLPWPLFALASLFTLVVTIDAYRSTAPGSASRRRARAYAIAFGLRDALYAAAIAWWSIATFGLRSDAAAWAAPILTAITPLAFVALLAYGILSTQLFDINLKIKTGIQRSTVVTIGIVAVLGALKTVEYSFNRTLGAVAAGLVAGLVLVLAPRLNKLGDRVANAAMPAVQPTSDYIAFKKLEVYKAALEAAHETGGITEKDRASLDRLRSKLGLKEADARAIESELAAVPSA